MYTEFVRHIRECVYLVWKFDDQTLKNTINPKPKPKPVINKPPSLNRDYNRDPNIRALQRRGFMNHGSPLAPKPDTFSPQAQTRRALGTVSGAPKT